MNGVSSNDSAALMHVWPCHRRPAHSKLYRGQERGGVVGDGGADGASATDHYVERVGWCLDGGGAERRCMYKGMGPVDGQIDRRWTRECNSASVCAGGSSPSFNPDTRRSLPRPRRARLNDDGPTAATARAAAPRQRCSEGGRICGGLCVMIVIRGLGLDGLVLTPCCLRTRTNSPTAVSARSALSRRRRSDTHAPAMTTAAVAA